MKKAKFKVGQKVKVLPVEVGCYEHDSFEESMTEMIGNTYSIESVREDTIKLHDQRGVAWNFQYDWVELVEDVKERPKRNRSFKMSNKQKLDILRTTKGKFFSCVFTKQSGEERKMNCRLGVAKGLKGGENNHKGHEEYATVYDMVNKGYRNINLDTLKSIKMAGATITFT
jgi:hypothetical protein